MPVENKVLIFEGEEHFGIISGKGIQDTMKGIKAVIKKYYEGNTFVCELDIYMERLKGSGYFDRRDNAVCVTIQHKHIGTTKNIAKHCTNYDLTVADGLHLLKSVKIKHNFGTEDVVRYVTNEGYVDRIGVKVKMLNDDFAMFIVDVPLQHPDYTNVEDKKEGVF